MPHFWKRRLGIILAWLAGVLLLVSYQGNAQIKPITFLGTHLKKQYTDDLPGLLNRRYIRVLTTFNKTNFYLAAYNAGPAKVRRARRLAQKMGLDPDRWFRNVEIAMLRLVGQETVRYVSNINKYYILYKLALSAGQMKL